MGIDLYLGAGQFTGKNSFEVAILDITAVIGAQRDRETVGLIRTALEADGIQFFLESQTQKNERVGDDKIITFIHAGQTKTLAVDEILLAAGRRPNIEGLNLEAAGVAYL